LSKPLRLEASITLQPCSRAFFRRSRLPAFGKGEEMVYFCRTALLVAREKSELVRSLPKRMSLFFCDWGIVYVLEENEPSPVFLLG
jgi:hypothetical protein